MYGGLKKYHENESFEVVLKLLHKNASKIINPSDPNASGTTANVWLLRNEEPLPEGQVGGLRMLLFSTTYMPRVPAITLAFDAQAPCDPFIVQRLLQIPWNNNCCLDGQGANQMRMNQRARAKGISTGRGRKKLTPAAAAARVRTHATSGVAAVNALFHFDCAITVQWSLFVPCSCCFAAAHIQTLVTSTRSSGSNQAMGTA